MPEQQTYDRYSREPALSTRGYVLVVLIPVLIAAAGFGVVTIIDHAKSTATVTSVRVPTSSWIPGQRSGSELIRGTVSADTRHCIYLQTDSGEQVWPVWPAGYTGKVDDQGRVSVYDGHDQLVARDGQKIQATGQRVGAAAYSGESCLPSDGQVVEVQSEVTATQ